MRLLKPGFLLIWIMVLIPFYAQSQFDESIHIILTNIKSVEGTIMIAIYDRPETFLSNEVLLGLSLPVETKPEMDVYISGLPQSQFAISIYQDINNNERLDTNLFGKPKEPFAFSNKARGKMGPPRYRDAVIQRPFNREPILISLN